jgi:uridine kinase
MTEREPTLDSPVPATLGISVRDRGRTVNVIVNGSPREVAVGTALGAVLDTHVAGLPVVAALVDRQATTLSTAVTFRCQVEALTTASWEGQRIYRRSLALLALEAAQQLSPGAHLRMGPSVGFGQRLMVSGLVGTELGSFAHALEDRMHELATHGMALREELWTVGEAQEYFSHAGWVDAEQLVAQWREGTVAVVSYGSVYALSLGPMVSNLRVINGFHVLQDGDLLLLVYGRRSISRLRPTQTMPAVALSGVGEPPGRTPSSTRSVLIKQVREQAAHGYDVDLQEQAWLRALGISSVGTFNRACVEGSVPQMIRVTEGFGEKRLGVIADEIQGRIADVDVVCIAGPSSSGKTTFIRRLSVQLQVNGITPVGLGMDDYYVDREQSPRDAAGDYDFEALTALRLELLQEHVQRLLAGETVNTARYRFKEGRSEPQGGPRITLGQRDVLLLEGIHGLNPELLGHIAPERVFRIFVCPLLQLPFDHLATVHASDVRLVRRIVRDRHARGISAKETIERWPKVRIGERTHIYPYQLHADAVYDSSLVYELAVLRVYAERYLREVPRDHVAFTTAYRLMHLLDRFVSIYPDHVPPTSILREFIGGSGFEY